MTSQDKIITFHDVTIQTCLDCLPFLSILFSSRSYSPSWIHQEVVMRFLTSSIFSALLILFGAVPSTAAVTVNPFGLGVSVEEGGQEQVEFTLNNDSMDEIPFCIKSEWLQDEDIRQGPERDDPGDVLAQYQKPYNMIHGLAWDYDHNWMWGVGFERHLYAMDLEDEREIVVDVEVEFQMAGMFYLDGIIHIGGWGGGGNHVYRWDTEGNALDRLVLPQNPGLAYIAGNSEHILANNFGDTRIFVFNTVDQEHIATPDFAQATNGNGAWSLEWVDAHRNGELWLSGLDVLYQCTVDEDWNIERVQNFGAARGTNSAIAHDGENIWYGVFDNPFQVIDDGVSEFRMLSFDPAEGIIPGEDSQAVAMNIDTEGAEPGVYNMLIEIEIQDPNIPEDQDFPVIALSAVISVESPVADITGIVINADGNQPVEDVNVEMAEYIMKRFTDEEGSFAFNELPPGQYTLALTAPDFLPQNVEVDLGDENEELNLGLLHAQCNLHPEEITHQLAPDDAIELAFEVHNDGNGPLQYTVERRLTGEAAADIWERRSAIHIGEEMEDTRIEGVVFADDRFFVSAGGNGNPCFYILDHDGNHIETIAQPQEEDDRLRDLAWDGQLIWGVTAHNIYGITLDGGVEIQLDSPHNATQAIAWDSDRNWLWCAGITTDIVAVDLDGEPQAEIDHGELRIYGLAYWYDDPDGCPLYILSSPGQDCQEIYKVNPNDPELIFVTTIQPEEGGRSGGIFITNQYDIYSWVMMSVSNDGRDDRVELWQVDARLDWFDVDPVVGGIEAGQMQEFTLDLDATGLEPAAWRGDVVFLHDGRGSETHLPVTLDVVAGRVPTERTLQLELGWNMVSVNLQPDEEDVTVLTRDLVDGDLLLMMKDGFGHFYNPAFNYNDIPGWFVEQGYLMKISDACELTLTGMSVLAEDPIDLIEGWQMIGYYPRIPVDARVALSGIRENLMIAKDGHGHFYLPDWNFSDMGNMIEGQGYLVKLAQEDRLVYTLREEEVCSQRLLPSNTERTLPEHPVTGENMSLLVLSDEDMTGEIGVTCQGNLVGSGIIANGKTGIAIWGDDPTTGEFDGALSGQGLSLEYYLDGEIHDVDYVSLQGEAVYQSNGLWIVQLENLVQIPTEFGISDVYPNPFNRVMRLDFSLPEASEVSIAVYDVNGRLVERLISGRMEAGRHQTVWEASAASAGLYLVRMEAAGHSDTRKINLVK